MFAYTYPNLFTGLAGGRTLTWSYLIAKQTAALYGSSAAPSYQRSRRTVVTKPPLSPVPTAGWDGAP